MLQTTISISSPLPRMENRSLGENLKLDHLVYNEEAWDQEKEEIVI